MNLQPEMKDLARRRALSINSKTHPVFKLQGDPALSAMTSKFGYQEVKSCA